MHRGEAVALYCAVAGALSLAFFVAGRLRAPERDEPLAKTILSGALWFAFGGFILPLLGLVLLVAAMRSPLDGVEVGPGRLLLPARSETLGLVAALAGLPVIAFGAYAAAYHGLDSERFGARILIGPSVVVAGLGIVAAGLYRRRRPGEAILVDLRAGTVSRTSGGAAIGSCALGDLGAFTVETRVRVLTRRRRHEGTYRYTEYQLRASGLREADLFRSDVEADVQRVQKRLEALRAQACGAAPEARSL